MKEYIVPIIIACGGALIAAVVSIVTLILNRKWQKEDRRMDKLDAITAELVTVKQTLNDHIDADTQHNAKQARRRVIEFSDECRRGVLHSKEHFENVLEDADYYEQYCATHKHFENSKAEQSIRFVKDTYDQCKRENKYI